MGNIFSNLKNNSTKDILQIVPPITVGDLITRFPVSEQYPEGMDESKLDHLLSFLNKRIDEVGENVKSMRRVHNMIKNDLITRFGRNVRAKRLLDIAVGKGGDMEKWYYAGIIYAFGFDINQTSIDEARSQRLPQFIEKLKKKGKQDNFNYVFKSTKELHWDHGRYFMPQLDDSIGVHSFDVVSCQFAIHYFSDTPKHLNELFGFINTHIKPGGYFIGTTLSNKKLKQLMDGKKSFKNPYFSIEEYDGKSYSIHLNGTNYYESEGAKTKEYVVDMDKVVEVAKLNDFIPISTKLFGDSTFEPNKQTKNYSEFYNAYPIDKELLTFSHLNTTFVFQKKK
jgi:mRNA (guanine-N7-)-methyltransferase